MGSSGFQNLPDGALNCTWSMGLRLSALIAVIVLAKAKLSAWRSTNTAKSNSKDDKYRIETRGQLLM